MNKKLKFHNFLKKGQVGNGPRSGLGHSHRHSGREGPGPLQLRKGRGEGPQAHAARGRPRYGHTPYFVSPGVSIFSIECNDNSLSAFETEIFPFCNDFKICSKSNYLINLISLKND